MATSFGRGGKLPASRKEMIPTHGFVMFQGEIGLGKLHQGLEDLGWRKYKNPASDHELKVPDILQPTL